MSTLCVIPARGGSKRIPRKNIKDFYGKPIIAYSIEAAIDSGCFDKVIVSTDDEEIAIVAQQYGAEVPFMRSTELSDDYTGTTAVIADAIQQLSKQEFDASYTCCLYATAPFIQIEDIQNSYTLIKAGNLSYAFGITDYAFPIQRAIKLDNNHRVSMFDDEQFNTRSQDLARAWHDAGQFYWGKSQAWLDNTLVFSPESAGYKIPRYRVQDIDTIEDWMMAELMYQAIADIVSNR